MGLAPVQNPTLAPALSPTSAPEGCYSKDYMNCIPDGYDSSDRDTCGTVWLPDGERTDCTALWGKCSQDTDCCGEAVCFGGAACVPPSDEPDPTPAPIACIICDDVETP